MVIDAVFYMRFMGFMGIVNLVRFNFMKIWQLCTLTYAFAGVLLGVPLCGGSDALVLGLLLHRGHCLGSSVKTVHFSKILLYALVLISRY